MTTVLVITNETPADPGGRAERLGSRRDRLADDDIRVVFGKARQPYILAFLPSLVACLRMGFREDVDLVNSVSNPFHLQVIGFLVSTLLRVPWLAEFRDPMAESPDRDPDALLTRVSRLVERFVVRTADHIVWSNGIQLPDGYFVDTYGIDPSRVTKLPFQGYRPEEFEGVEPYTYEEFTVTYAGSFYEGWLEPDRFLDGLAAHVDEHGSEGIHVQFYGDWTDEYQERVEDHGLTGVVTHHEFVPHEEIVPVLKSSDVVLYIGGDDPRNRLNVPSKIWDYVGARTPMLAIVDPEFRVAEFVESHGVGIVADPDDAEAIAAALTRFRTGKFEYDPDPAVFEFTREKRLSVLTELYEEMVQG